ncbi:MAG: DM13 domain-containing protein [Saprospiraceae bacterium]
MNKLLVITLFALLSFTACIQDDIINDFVEPILSITSSVDSIEINTSFQFESKFLNNVGVEEAVDVTWISSDPSVISINNDGLAEALEKGTATITVEYIGEQNRLTDTRTVSVGETTTIQQSQAKSGMIETTSSYALTGDFTLEQNGSDLILNFDANYNASTALPGLYVYLTNNRNTTANAYEIGAVQVFSGEHSYTIPNADINDYNYVLYFCKPFNVKVGDGEIQ